MGGRIDGGGQGVGVASEVAAVVIDPLSILMGGGTEPPYIKITADGTNLSGPAGRDDVAPDIFVCAVGCLLPIFSTEDLRSSTALSRWLTFY